jgi:hypothetical protein
VCLPVSVYYTKACRPETLDLTKNVLFPKLEKVYYNKARNSRSGKHCFLNWKKFIITKPETPDLAKVVSYFPIGAKCH